MFQSQSSYGLDKTAFFVSMRKKSEDFFGKKILLSVSKSERQVLGLWSWNFWQGLHSCILRVWREILERIITSGNLCSFHRFRTSSEKFLFFVILFFIVLARLWKQPSPRPWEQFEEKRFFSENYFFPKIFVEWVIISPVLQEYLGRFAETAFYCCMEKFWGKWSFLEQFLSIVFQFRAEKLGLLSTFSNRVLETAVNLSLRIFWGNRVFLEFFFFFTFSDVERKQNSGSWQRNVRRLVKTPFYFSVEEILREVFLLKEFLFSQKLPGKKLALFVESFNFGVFVKIDSTCPECRFEVFFSTKF